MNYKRFVIIFAGISLFCSTISIHAATLPELKQSFSHSVKEFIACLKGEQSCDPKKIKAYRAAMALASIVILAATGASIYGLYTWRQQQIASPKTNGTLPPAGIPSTSEEKSKSTQEQPLREQVEQLQKQVEALQQKEQEKSKKQTIEEQRKKEEQERLRREEEERWHIEQEKEQRILDNKLMNAIGWFKNYDKIYDAIRSGANVNQKSEFAEVPLIQVIKGFPIDKGAVNAVYLLVGKGADVNAADKNGKKVLTIAKEKAQTDPSYQEIVDRLSKAGATE